MGLYKAIQYGKEHRKPYLRSKAVDYTCRNHGRCSYCREGRLFQRNREEQMAMDKLRDFKNSPVSSELGQE
jgi:hypothetical protein